MRRRYDHSDSAFGASAAQSHHLFIIRHEPEWPTRKNVAGATVSVVDGPNAGSATVTDASGNYRLAGLEHGEFTIVVSAPEHIPQTITGSLTSNRQVNFELRHRGAVYEVTGRVIDEDGCR